MRYAKGCCLENISEVGAGSLFQERLCMPQRSKTPGLTRVQSLVLPGDNVAEVIPGQSACMTPIGEPGFMYLIPPEHRDSFDSSIYSV